MGRDDHPQAYCEAETLLSRLAEKLVEPMNSDVDGSKTLEQWRREISEIHKEIIAFELHRRNQP